MKRAAIALASAVVLLTGCGHSDNAAEASAPPSADAAYTGLPASSPRALPAAASASPAKPAPAPAAVAENPPQVAPAPAAPPPPPVEAPPPPSPPEPPPTFATTAPTPAPVPPEPPAPALETTPPSPPVATLPPRPMDENEAKRQVVVLETSFGNIVIELNDVAAPRTCGNFRKLVSSGFYNHTLFHRVIPNFMIQGGDPNTRSDERRTYGLGDPGYSLPAEIELKNVAGAVAMARLPDATNPHRESNGSQFYICVADCPSLDGKYTVFGRVIRGMDTVKKIANQPRDKSDDPTDRIEIQATIETKQQALAENPR